MRASLIAALPAVMLAAGPALAGDPGSTYNYPVGGYAPPPVSGPPPSAAPTPVILPQLPALPPGQVQLPPGAIPDDPDIDAEFDALGGDAPGEGDNLARGMLAERMKLLERIELMRLSAGSHDPAVAEDDVYNPLARDAEIARNIALGDLDAEMNTARGRVTELERQIRGADAAMQYPNLDFDDYEKLRIRRDAATQRLFDARDALDKLGQSNETRRARVEQEFNAARDAAAEKGRQAYKEAQYRKSTDEDVVRGLEKRVKEIDELLGAPPRR